MYVTIFPDVIRLFLAEIYPLLVNAWEKSWQILEIFWQRNRFNHAVLATENF